MMFRAAVIGCGKIGSEFADDPRGQGVRSHAEAYRACPSTRLIALCDTDTEKLERCGRRWDVRAVYVEPLQLLTEMQPEIVSVCTPDDTHYELIRQCVSSPHVRAVLAEKPLALTLAHAEELDRLARERGILLAVNYSRRYARSFERLRDFLRTGGIGRIQALGGYYSKGTLHNGTHWFDLARHLVGEVAGVWGVDAMKEGGRDPTLDAFLEFEGGIGGCLQGCAASAFDIFEMDILGTTGRVRVVESGARFEKYTVSENPRYTGYRALCRVEDLVQGPQNELLHAVENLVGCLTRGESPRCSSRDGVAALEIALAVRESARSGCPVLLRQS